MEFKELDDEVRAAGLYARTPVKYIVHFTLVTLGVFLSFYFLSVTDNIYLQIVNGIFSAFVLVQAGMLGHDLSHGQVFKSDKINHYAGAFIWGIFGGLSEGGWYEKHNAHHKHVNHEGMDPDLEIPFIFSNVQVADKPRFVQKYMQPYQHVLFFVLLPFVYPNFILWSTVRVFTNITLKNTFEALLIVSHFFIIFYLAFLFLPWIAALSFCITSFLFSGLYMGMVFAPNHKGEEVLAKDQEHTWVHQITLTRNLHYSKLGFIFFGGLDLQVEHHLFPSMSRYNYPRAQKIVKEYCEKNNIRYYETTWFGSMREIYISLKDNSVVLNHKH